MNAVFDIVEVVVAGAGADEVVGRESTQFLVALPLVEFGRDETHLVPLLLGEDGRLTHLQHTVALGLLQTLDNLPMHVTEYQICHILQLDRQQSQQLTRFYLTQVVLSIIALVQRLQKLLNDVPDLV